MTAASTRARLRPIAVAIAVAVTLGPIATAHAQTAPAVPEIPRCGPGDTDCRSKRLKLILEQKSDAAVDEILRQLLGLKVGQPIPPAAEPGATVVRQALKNAYADGALDATTVIYQDLNEARAPR